MPAARSVDERLKGGASAEYYFNPTLSVYARYEYTDFFSTDRLERLRPKTKCGSACASGTEAVRSDQLLDLGEDRVAQLRPLQRIGDIGGEEAGLGAAVEGAALIFQRVEGLLGLSSASIASVSWISPPAPFSCSDRRSKISGCRM